jgi:hypothetical protein
MGYFRSNSASASCPVSTLIYQSVGSAYPLSFRASEVAAHHIANNPCLAGFQELLGAAVVHRRGDALRADRVRRCSQRILTSTGSSTWRPVANFRHPVTVARIRPSTDCKLEVDFLMTPKALE